MFKLTEDRAELLRRRLLELLKPQAVDVVDLLIELATDGRLTVGLELSPTPYRMAAEIHGSDDPLAGDRYLCLFVDDELSARHYLVTIPLADLSSHTWACIGATAENVYRALLEHERIVFK